MTPIDLTTLTLDQRRLVRAAIGELSRRYHWSDGTLLRRAEHMWPLTITVPRETPEGMFGLQYRRNLAGELEYHESPRWGWMSCIGTPDALAAYEWLKEHGFTIEVEEFVSRSSRANPPPAVPEE